MTRLNQIKTLELCGLRFGQSFCCRFMCAKPAALHLFNLQSSIVRTGKAGQTFLIVWIRLLSAKGIIATSPIVCKAFPPTSTLLRRRTLRNNVFRYSRKASRTAVFEGRARTIQDNISSGLHPHPTSEANSVLMFYQHYHQSWFFTILFGLLTPQTMTL